MRRTWLTWGLLVLALGNAGCRCFPGFNCYADAIDDISDRQIFWEDLYVPRLDISRAGKPDWCGPINRRLAPCRCDCEPQWDRANECWRYPSGYPYSYPDQSLSTTIPQTVAPAATAPAVPPAPETAPAAPAQGAPGLNVVPPPPPDVPPPPPFP